MIEQKFVDLYAHGAKVPLLVAERDVVLTYVLRILADVGLLPQLAFKGGTCIRKIYFGRTARFSEDLDFTVLTDIEPEELILQVAGAFDGKSYYDITFSVGMPDFYVREDRRARDVFDLFRFQQQPFDRSLVRTLTVLKLWSVDDAFDPDRFLAGLPSVTYEWSDLTRLLRKDEQPNPQQIIAGCVQGYAFLRNLTLAERTLAQDRHRSRQDIFDQISSRLS